MLTFITFVLVFGTIVFFHEFGHFSAAKLAGIRVEEFALGFGPTLAGKEVGETKYSLRAFPLGGFVRLAGMEEMVLEGKEGPSADDQGSFQNKSLPWRLATIAAGPPLMNFVLAIVLFTLFFLCLLRCRPESAMWNRLPPRRKLPAYCPVTNLSPSMGRQWMIRKESSSLLKCRPGSRCQSESKGRINSRLYS